MLYYILLQQQQFFLSKEAYNYNTTNTLAHTTNNYTKKIIYYILHILYIRIYNTSISGDRGAGAVPRSAHPCSAAQYASYMLCASHSTETTNKNIHKKNSRSHSSTRRGLTPAACATTSR